MNKRRFETGLAGATGFVGGTLSRQTHIARGFNSRTIREAGNASYATFICAAAPAQKWIANRDPDADRAVIDSLIGNLDGIVCDRFILISTVDVFKSPVGVDEESPVDETGLHAYGLHRRRLEKFVAARFANHLIVRLPGLVGPGLRKNVIFDFLNDNNLDAIDSRGIFQFYPMVNLWPDIELAIVNKLSLLHLTAEPIAVAEVARLGFNRSFDQSFDRPAAVYDMKTRYAKLFAAGGGYQYSRRESIMAIRAYAQSEPRAKQKTGGH